MERVIEYIVEENDYMVDWEDEYPSEEIIKTQNREEALKAFTESSWRELHVFEGNDSFSIMYNLKGIVWGYDEKRKYVPGSTLYEDMNGRQKQLYDDLVNRIIHAVKKSKQ